MKKSSSLKFLMLGLLAVACLVSFRFDNDMPFADEIVQFVSNDDAKEYTTQRGDNPTFTEKFTMNGPGFLDVTTSGGGIKVEGSSGNEVEVQVFVRKNGRLLSNSNSLMEELQNDYNLKIEKDGDRITAYTKREGNYGWSKKSLSIGFKVYVPMEMTCDLRTSGGGIKMAKLIGAQQVRTSGGGISMEEIKGAVDASTSGGGIKVSNQLGNLKLNTSGGRIQVANAKGDVNGRTSGGSIKIEDIDGEVDVRTSGGSIGLYGMMPSVKASTSGGGIKAEIKGLQKRLDLNTSGGSITATVPGGMGMDLYLRGNHVNVDLQNFSGTSKKGKVDGSMNGGGLPVNMTTSGGSVNLYFKGGTAQ
ncbi:MAG: DUF4097 family beta strand repeat-containing protein [Bacteroidota bacterium]